MPPPNPLQMLGTPMGNTQSNNTPYQTFGQGYNPMPIPSYGPGPMPSLPGGYPLTQPWGTQGYAAALPFPSLHYSADALFGPPLGYPQNQMFDQGYLTSPPNNSLFPSPGTGTMYDTLQGMYNAPGQTWGQDINNNSSSMAWNPSFLPEVPPAAQPLLPSQIYSLRHNNNTAPAGNPSQSPGERAKSKKIASPVPVTPPRPLRPLLPRSDPPPVQAQAAEPTPPPPPSTPRRVPASLASLSPAPPTATAATTPVLPSATMMRAISAPTPTPATPPQPEGAKQQQQQQHNMGDSPYREWLKRQASYRNAVKSYKARSEDGSPKTRTGTGTGTGAGGSSSPSTSRKPPRQKKK